MKEKFEPARIIKLPDPDKPDKQVEQWQKENERRIEAENIKKIISNGETKEGRKMSDEEKIELLERTRNQDWISLNDLETLKVTGFFVSESCNMDGKLMIMEIKNGKMLEHDVVDVLTCYSCTDTGKFFENRDHAVMYIHNEEDPNEDEEY
jgi:hypothetical protein